MPRDDFLLLDNIAVYPDHYGQGLGGRLLALADGEATRLGYRELRLHAHVTMTENIALYRAKGWVVTGQASKTATNEYSCPVVWIHDVTA